MVPTVLILGSFLISLKAFVICLELKSFRKALLTFAVKRQQLFGQVEDHKRLNYGIISSFKHTNVNEFMYCDHIIKHIGRAHNPDHTITTKHTQMYSYSASITPNRMAFVRLPCALMEDTYLL